MNDYLTVRELYHHGIKGQKWGVRRYQNEDGTLTDAGKKLRDSGRIGAAAGAAAGFGVGYGLVKRSLKKKTWTGPKDATSSRQLVDAVSGRSLHSFLTTGVFKVAGATFVGGFLGRSIARATTKSAIKKADKAVPKAEDRVSKPVVDAVDTYKERIKHE